MKIYDKKLSNLRDLKKERQLLKIRLHGEDKPHGENDKQASKSGSVKEEKEESFISGLLSGITSGSVLTSALNIAPTVFDIIKNRSLGRAKITPQSHKNTVGKKSFVTTALTDFVSGYIKWKILELTYKGIKKALKSDAGKKISHDATSKLKNIFNKK